MSTSWSTCGNRTLPTSAGGGAELASDGANAVRAEDRAS